MIKILERKSENLWCGLMTLYNMSAFHCFRYDMQAKEDNLIGVQYYITTNSVIVTYRIDWLI